MKKIDYEQIQDAAHVICNYCGNKQNNGTLCTGCIVQDSLADAAKKYKDTPKPTIHDVKDVAAKFLEKQDDIWKDDSGVFYQEIYKDYDEQLSCELISQISLSDTPDDEFFQIMNEAYANRIFEIEDNMLDLLNNDKDIMEIIQEFDDPKEILRDVLFDVFYVKIPTEDYKKQEVCVNILLDTGNLNYDCTCENFYPHYDGQRGDVIMEESSILWLLRQQGYKKSDLNEARFNGTDNEFLTSLVNEVGNCSSHMNTLTFLVKMTLQDYMNLLEKINAEKSLNQSYYPKERKGRGKIKINKSVHCGLTDCWQGAGSILDIHLERDVILPIRYIWQAVYDSAEKYGVGSVYGLCSSAWKEALVA